MGVVRALHEECSEESSEIWGECGGSIPLAARPFRGSFRVTGPWL